MEWGVKEREWMKVSQPNKSSIIRHWWWEATQQQTDFGKCFQRGQQFLFKSQIGSPDF